MAEQDRDGAPTDGRVRRARDAVDVAARRLGLDPAGSRLVREGSAVLLHLPGAGALARVDDRSGTDTARRQAAVADLLARAEVPAVRLVGAGAQPVVVDGADGAAVAVTVWRWEREVRRRPTPGELGRLARRLHDATAALVADLGPAEVAAVPVADPVAAVIERLGRVQEPDADHTLLAEVCDRLHPVWAARAGDAERVVHADFHAGNVLVTRAGLLLADLELAGLGPWAYDLAPQVVAVRRYGASPADLDAFLAGYGRALPEDLEAMVEVYELWVSAWAVLNRGLDTAHEREAALRMARWRGAPTTGRWTLR